MTRKLKILLIEDNPGDADLVHEALAKAGPPTYEIIEVPRMSDALSHLNSDSYDLALLDLGLPDIAGIQTLKSLREAAPDLAVVVLTGNDDEATGLAAIESGAQDYLVKGQIRDIDLIRSIRHAIERKHSEEALQKSEELWRTVFAAANDVILILDEKYNLMNFNDEAEKKYGYSREEMLRLNVRDLRLPELLPLIEAQMEEVRISGGAIWESIHKRKDGTSFPVEISSRPFIVAGRQQFVHIIRDITERKQAENEKEKLHAQLLQAQKMESVGRLAGGVAHDFNNMLMVIIGHAELALNRINPSETIHGDLEEISNAAHRSADITRQLLAFARKQIIVPKALDLNDTVEGMLKMLRRLIGEDINLVWIPGSGVRPVKMDPSQIDQILANLCINARDAIDGVGRITIETQNISIDEGYCRKHADCIPGEYVMLSVKDNGCGMDRETIACIFEPFFTTKSLGQGTGLGLSTVYGIVKQNNGFIDVSSEPGKGTAFQVFLPRLKGNIKEIKAERAQEKPMGHGETVLIVEDDAPLMNLGKIMLKELGYAALTAGTPSEAINMAGMYGGEIDLLLTDVVMPEMNGLELARRIRAIKPEIRCLFMSGYTPDVVANQGVLDAGANFLQKPFSLQSLASGVHDALKYNQA